MPDEAVKGPEAGGEESPPAEGGDGVSTSGETTTAAPAAERTAETPVAESAEVLEATAEPGAGEEEEVDEFMSPAEAKLAEANARYVRLSADFDNFRKRTQRESARHAAGAGEALIREFLPVLDNLERALAACAAARVEDGSPHAAAVEAVATGVDLTLRQFKAALAKHGVERITAARGERFDPHRHDAVAQEEREEAREEVVSEELEAGYTMRGRVLRPAKVKVARPPV